MHMLDAGVVDVVAALRQYFVVHAPAAIHQDLLHVVREQARQLNLMSANLFFAGAAAIGVSGARLGVVVISNSVILALKSTRSMDPYRRRDALLQ